MHSYPVPLRSILILCSLVRLGLPNGLLHVSNHVQIAVPLPLRVIRPVHLILLDLTTVILFGEGAVREVPHYTISPSLPLGILPPSWTQICSSATYTRTP
jgi:hypothetical protein